MGKVATGEMPRIDFRGIAGRASLKALITAERGAPDRHGKWLCPVHDDHHPSLGLIAGGKRFKCWSCKAEGTVLDWIMRRDGIGIVEAARTLDPSIGPNPQVTHVYVSSKQPLPRPVPCPTREAVALPWRDPEWQAAADRLVVEAEAVLWSAGGRDALDWLRRRGLADHTIRMFRLGFLPEWVQTPPIAVLADEKGPRGIKAARGITIPWVVPGAWYGPRENPVDESGGPIPRWCGVNVRRLMSDVRVDWTEKNKCLVFKGSERGHAYPHCDLTAGIPCLIAEGEIDALLAFQEVGHLVNVLTTGGASVPPRPEAEVELSTCSHWLIATDRDDAGDASSAAWRSRGPRKARRLLLPHGNDIGEFVQTGGDLRVWLLSEFDRLGLDVAHDRPLPI